MDYVITLAAAYVATTAAAITLEAPRKLVFRIGIVGVVSYTLYMILTFRDVSTGLATFFACLLASLMAQVFARIYKAPVTTFYIPTFYLYVPGAAIYQTLFHFINGNTAESNYNLVETITVAGAIALGVFMSDSLIDTIKTISKKTKEKL